MKRDLVRNAEELRILLDELLLSRHVQSTLETCDAAEDAAQVAQRMDRMGHAVLGVRQAGQVTGSLHRSRIVPGPCEAQREPLVERAVIDGETSLLTLLERLHDRDWVFVRNQGRLDGFVSRSDLQRPAVRMLLFGLLTLFEMQLLDMVQRTYDEVSLARVLKPGRLDQARRLHQDRARRGELLQLTDCLQIADKRDLLLAAEGFPGFFGFPSKKDAHRFLVHVESLRDRLVHAQDLIAGSSWEDATSTVLQMVGFLRHYERHQDDFPHHVHPA